MNVRWLGRIGYAAALAMQEEIVSRKIGEPDAADELLLLEHEPVYTIGRTPDQSSLRGGAHLPHPLFQINRGGQATYHGPGQLVGYPLINLRRYVPDLHRYLRWIEEVLIQLLAVYGLVARRRAALTGVWVEDRKIASIGVGVRHWITMHGFALNVCGDLSAFDQITPCGITNVSMTSVERETGEAISVRDVAREAERVIVSALATLHEAATSSMTIPLEDTVADVIGKAQRGLGISDSELAQRAGISPGDVRAARSGEAQAGVLEKIAPPLQLDASTLLDLAEGSYKPRVQEIDGLAMFNTSYGDMTVNAYLAWDPASRAAIAFDTGADCGEMLKTIDAERLRVGLILLTHSHPDHIEDLRRLAQATGAPVYISDRESAPGAQAIEEGRQFSAGGLGVEAILTWGHSPGGMTYFVSGLEKPVAIVGDAIFAGSMGGGNVSYSDAVQTNAGKILTLPDETIICPGHGPLTTVANEKAHNPFFAHRFRK